MLLLLLLQLSQSPVATAASRLLNGLCVIPPSLENPTTKRLSGDVANIVERRTNSLSTQVETQLVRGRVGGCFGRVPQPDQQRNNDKTEEDGRVAAARCRSLSVRGQTGRQVEAEQHRTEAACRQYPLEHRLLDVRVGPVQL